MMQPLLPLQVAKRARGGGESPVSNAKRPRLAFRYRCLNCDNVEEAFIEHHQHIPGNSTTCHEHRLELEATPESLDTFARFVWECCPPHNPPPSEYKDRDLGNWVRSVRPGTPCTDSTELSSAEALDMAGVKRDSRVEIGSHAGLSSKWDKSSHGTADYETALKNNHFEIKPDIQDIEFGNFVAKLKLPLTVGEKLSECLVELPLSGQSTATGLDTEEPQLELADDVVRSLEHITFLLSDLEVDDIRNSSVAPNETACVFDLTAIAAVNKGMLRFFLLSVRKCYRNPDLEPIISVGNSNISSKHYEDFLNWATLKKAKPDMITGVHQDWVCKVVQANVPYDYYYAVASNIWLLIQICPTADLAFAYLLVENKARANRNAGLHQAQGGVGAVLEANSHVLPDSQNFVFALTTAGGMFSLYICWRDEWEGGPASSRAQPPVISFHKMVTGVFGNRRDVRELQHTLLRIHLWAMHERMKNLEAALKDKIARELKEVLVRAGGTGPLGINPA
ncbi:hypothetical protein GGR53DRAFT_498165 [Hypoxylon sp. FL1150]|nr:hypothetical protein GGR53DRAFT_498165 [Hypoxylon sp. FL1150]